MLNSIIRAALGQRVLVLVLAIAVGGYGLYTAATMPIDVLPDLDRPVVSVLTDAHGMATPDVERLVSLPIEQAVNGAAGVHRVRSMSAAGYSAVKIEFAWGSDLYRNRQVVAEKLQLAAARLPEGITPVMAPVSSIMGQIQFIGFSSEGGVTSPADLLTLVKRDIQPRLLSLPGVSQVTLSGGEPTELQVVVDADRLRASGAALHEIETAIQGANVTANGGILKQGPRGPLVSVAGLLDEEQELAKAVVRAEQPRSLLIEDVAEVGFGPSPIRIGDAGVDGNPAVIMVVAKQPGVDTVALTERVQEELQALRAQLPKDIVIIDDVFQQAAFIHRAIDNVLVAVRDGAILVVIILFLFLLSFRTTFITLTAIPLSVAVAALVFHALGLTINTMTLGGLAVAIGTLVDDAIVDVENVYRRLHENAAREQPRNIVQVVFEASSEIRRPVLTGTLLVTVVYLPLFFLQGIEGRLFVPIGLAYVISVFASLFIALTVTPVACFYLLGKTKARDGEYGGWLVRGLQKLSASVMRFSMRHAMAVAGVVLALVVACAALFVTRGTTFLPEFQEGTFQVNLVLDPDVDIAVSDEYGTRLEEVLGKIEGVDHVGRRTGRAEGDEHAMLVNISEAILTLDPDSGRSREDFLEEIRSTLETEFPGVVTATEQPLKHLMDALLSGVSATVAIKISGEDLSVLRAATEEVEGIVSGIDGVIDVARDSQVLVDQLVVRPKRGALAQHGLSTQELAETVSLAMGAEAVSQLRRGRLLFPIVVRLAEKDRNSAAALRRLPLTSASGGTVLLQDVAEVRFEKVPATIERENGQRVMAVQHNVTGRPLSEVVADVEAALAPVAERLAADSAGSAIRVEGQFEAQERASQLILWLSLASLAAILVILYLHFQSMRLATLILLTRPVAFIGAILAVVLTGQVVSIATLVGLIALLGISSRNAILLVDHQIQLMREQRLPFSEELVVQAGRERVVPILMTALTSGIGLVPLALAPDQPGRELLYPVATVMIGGLISNTIFDFLVTPGVLKTFGAQALDTAGREVTAA